LDFWWALLHYLRCCLDRVKGLDPYHALFKQMLVGLRFRFFSVALASRMRWLDQDTASGLLPGEVSLNIFVY